MRHLDEALQLRLATSSRIVDALDGGEGATSGTLAEQDPRIAKGEVKVQAGTPGVRHSLVSDVLWRPWFPRREATYRIAVFGALDSDCARILDAVSNEFRDSVTKGFLHLPDDEGKVLWQEFTTEAALGYVDEAQLFARTGTLKVTYVRTMGG